LGLNVRFRRVAFAGLFACAVPVLLAQAQSDADSPSTSISGQIARKKVAAKPSGASITRSTLASGESQDVCFQRGIGWLRIPQSSMTSMQRTSAMGSSAATQAGASPPGSESGTVSVLPSGTHQTKLDQCAGIPTSAASGAAIETMAADGQSKGANSDMRTTDANAGAQNWLQADTLLNPASGAASTRLTMGLTSSFSSSKHFSHGTPGSSTNSIQEFETQAYISPIKLRRMMRNAPDLETRFKLRELSEEEMKKPSKSAGSGPNHKGQLEDQRGKTSQSKSMSDDSRLVSGDEKTHANHD
jgi:hypothetical protein